MTIKETLEVLRKQYNCWTTATFECPIQCEKCEKDVNFADFLEALKTVLDAFGNGSEIPNSSGDLISRQADLIDRAEAQTELQFAARRYTVAHEAHGEGQVVWSENLISVTDAMNALRKVPSVQAQQMIPTQMSGTSEDTISRQAAIDAIMNTDETGYIYWKTHYKDLIEALPSAQPDWNEMIVICDCCGHAIRVKRHAYEPIEGK